MKTTEWENTAEPSLWSRFTRWFFDRDIELNSAIWNRLPAQVAESDFGRRMGRNIQRRVQRVVQRQQSTATYFLRNRPELELMCRLLDEHALGPRLDIAVLGCSKGAEVYSIVSYLRRSKPNLDLHIDAIDIDRDVVEFARRGVYSVLFGAAACAGPSANGLSAAEIAARTYRDQPSSPFERMTESEFREMFETTGNQAQIRPHLRESITWHVLDASAPGLLNRIGLQDIVFANRFLCHMAPADAENCLMNAMTLVKPGGFLFVSGIDLDVRAKTARKMGWVPIISSIKEIHEGDPSILAGWPLSYWGLEPFDVNRPDWAYRYASVFQSSASGAAIFQNPATRNSAA